jgi:site-specific recombinase XerC
VSAEFEARYAIDPGEVQFRQAHMPDTGLAVRYVLMLLPSARTKNLRAVQLLLGHRRLESTVKYLGIEVDDSLEMAERTEC